MRRGARLLMYIGTAVTVLLLGKLHAAEIGNYDFTGSARFAWSIAYIGILCAAAYGVGLPELPRTPWQAIVSGAGAATGAAVGISLFQLATGDALLPRFVVFSSALAVLPLYLICTAVSEQANRRRAGRDRVVAVVGPAEAATLRADLDVRPEHPASLVRTMHLDEARGSTPHERPLVRAVEEAGAVVVVLDRAAQNDDAVVAQAALLHERGVRIRTLSLFYDEWLGKLPVGELERMALMFDIGEVHRARYGRVKRQIDIVLATAGFPLLLLAIPLVCAGNLVANRGRVFYRQERVGKGGRVFHIRKFRTMSAGTGPSDWTREDDPRITPFGRVLRRTHLDELPQLVNILRGDLAVVGPRPEQPRYVEELVEKIPFYGLRHLVRPGLTGWAQVKYPYGADEIDAVEKLQYEFYYLRHQSLSLDARIVGRTLRSIAGREGR